MAKIRPLNCEKKIFNIKIVYYYNLHLLANTVECKTFQTQKTAIKFLVKQKNRTGEWKTLQVFHLNANKRTG